MGKKNTTNRNNFNYIRARVCVCTNARLSARKRKAEEEKGNNYGGGEECVGDTPFVAIAGTYTHAHARAMGDHDSVKTSRLFFVTISIRARGRP